MLNDSSQTELIHRQNFVSNCRLTFSVICYLRHARRPSKVVNPSAFSTGSLDVGHGNKSLMGFLEKKLYAVFHALSPT